MRRIPSLYRRDPDEPRYLVGAVTPGCEWVLAGEGVARRQYDGIGVLYAPGSGGGGPAPDLDGWWFRRRVPVGVVMPERFEPAGGSTADGRVPGWFPAGWSVGADLLREAIAALPASDSPRPGTHELIGPRVRGNRDRVPRHLLIAHHDGDILDAPRHFEELRRWLLVQPYRGVVWHRGGPDVTMAKVRRRDLRP